MNVSTDYSLQIKRCSSHFQLILIYKLQKKGKKKKNYYINFQKKINKRAVTKLQANFEDALRVQVFVFSYEITIKARVSSLPKIINFFISTVDDCCFSLYIHTYAFCELKN